MFKINGSNPMAQFMVINNRMERMEALLNLNTEKLFRVMIANKCYDFL